MLSLLMHIEDGRARVLSNVTHIRCHVLVYKAKRGAAFPVVARHGSSSPPPCGQATLCRTAFDRHSGILRGAAAVVIEADRF
ncbi:hypothetical protein [Streptomyces diastatochromogenes]|uniref:hypothetical protein n=1 Tax=Streptomyces diastatochromogenes TaxID=42236 RepID=UPI003686DD32